MLMRFGTIVRLFHTVRYLKPVQIFGRVAFQIRKPRVEIRPAPSLRPVHEAWVVCAWRDVCLKSPATFSFLNEIHVLQSDQDWNNPAWDKLWLYNLHYFDDLSAFDSQTRTTLHQGLIERWISENPAPLGNGWEPYPLSLRIVNWIKWSLAGNELEAQWRDSLALQLRFLSQRLEWHLLGNHLLANAKALVFGGLFFSGHEAEKWLTKGLEILLEQLPEQILVDGGHFERSPMYHAIILEDLLDLINLAQSYGVKDAGSTLLLLRYQDWLGLVPRMLGWLHDMTHPDGDIGFFNDAAFGIAPSATDLADYAVKLSLSILTDKQEGPVVAHTASGYVRLEKGTAVCLLDVAPVGPNYLPGHAHADTLSFELSVFGQRVVVNSGTSCYGAGTQRQYERSTAAHSTVQIDGDDSSEVWGGFRVARRARPHGLEILEDGNVVQVSCAHDGYRRLPGNPTHSRQWRFDGESLEIMDSIGGKFGDAVARFHLHPDVMIHADGNQGQLRLAGGEILIWQVIEGKAEVTDSTWQPEFGRSIPSRCLDVWFKGPAVRIRFSWG